MILGFLKPIDVASRTFLMTVPRLGGDGLAQGVVTQDSTSMCPMTVLENMGSRGLQLPSPSQRNRPGIELVVTAGAFLWTHVFELEGSYSAHNGTACSPALVFGGTLCGPKRMTRSSWHICGAFFRQQSCAAPLPSTAADPWPVPLLADLVLGLAHGPNASYAVPNRTQILEVCQGGTVVFREETRRLLSVADA